MTMTQLRFLAVLATGLVVSPALAADPAYLFDALHLKDYAKSYRAAWDKLMKDVQPQPDWLVQFNKNFDGDSGALATVAAAGKSYELSFVCKPSDCAGRKFVVLFEAGGAHAFGALGGKGEDPEYFGAPSADEKDALAKAFKGPAATAGQN